VRLWGVRSGQKLYRRLRISAALLVAYVRHCDREARVAFTRHLGDFVTSPTEVVRQFFLVFSTGNVEKILECLTEDATWWVAGSIPNMSGENSKAVLGTLLRNAVTLYKEHALRITPSSMISDGDSVAVEADGYAELNDGKVYRNRYHFRIEVEGARIRAVREYSDTQHMYDTFAAYLTNGE
jgi:ketosteroid isomerase-like protein